MSRALMLRAGMLGEEIEDCERRLLALDEQRTQAEELVETLDRFAQVQRGERLLVPLAAGVFAHATCTGESELLLNVGADVVVTRTPEQVRERVHEQLAAMQKAQHDLHARFDALLAELDTLKERFKE